MPRVPGVTSTLIGAELSLVSPEEAAAPELAVARETRETGAAIAGQSRENVREILAVELERIRKRHLRQKNEAEAKIERQLNGLTLEFDKRVDYENFSDEYAARSTNAIQGVLGEIEDQDVLDVVTASSAALQNQRLANVRRRAAGLELADERAKLSVRLASLAESSALAPPGVLGDADRSEVRHDVDLELGAAVRAGTINDGESRRMHAGWIDQAAQATALAGIRNDPVRTLVELLNPADEKYIGFDPIRRQRAIDATLTELEELQSVDSAARRARDRELSNEILARIKDPAHPKGPLSGGDGVLELLYDYDIPAAPKQKFIDLVERKANGEDLNRIDYNVVVPLLRGIVQGQITDPAQLTAFIGDGLPIERAQSFTSMINALKDESPQRRTEAQAWNTFVGQYEDIINPRTGVMGLRTAEGSRLYYQWFIETLQRRDAGIANGLDLVSQLLNPQDRANFIGDRADQFTLTLLEKTQALAREAQATERLPDGRRREDVPEAERVRALDEFLGGGIPAPASPETAPVQEPVVDPLAVERRESRIRLRHAGIGFESEEEIRQRTMSVEERILSVLSPEDLALMNAEREKLGLEPITGEPPPLTVEGP